jgi:hypothetical protein
LNKGLFAWFRRKGPAQTADETSRAVGRRGVLRATAAALAAAGGAALIGKGATPAQAANGDTITVGNTFSGTATTELDVTGAPVGFKVTNNLAFTGIQGTSASGDGVSGNSTSGIGLVGRSSSGMGVFGSTDSSTNFGVMGTNFSGPGIAGFGADASATAPISGVGVGAWGVSSSAAAGVEGDNSTSGPGVFGGNTGSGVGVAGFGGAANATAPVSGSGVGVWGVSTAGAAGVEGNNVSGGPGVYGVSIGGGHGVLGSSTGSAFAVYGTNSNTGTGVYGDSQGGMGLWGVTNSSGQGIASPAVAGSNIAGGTAIAGFTDGPNSIGTAGASNSGLGVYGSSQSSVGVLGYTDTGSAVVGVANAHSAFAGYFVGSAYVTGALTVLGAKSAAVNTQGGLKRLYSVESPESWFEDFGSGQLSQGQATVTIEPGFAEVVKTDSYHVFLTAYADSQGLYVSERHSSGFTVKEQNGGKSGASFSYRIVAKRADIAGVRLESIVAPPTPVGPQEPVLDHAPKPPPAHAPAHR